MLSHARVPLTYLSRDGFELGKWAEAQLRAAQKRKLDSKRRGELDMWEFVWYAKVRTKQVR